MPAVSLGLTISKHSIKYCHLETQKRDSLFTKSMCPWDSQFQNTKSNTERFDDNYINPGFGLSLVDNLWNASSYRQPLEQEGNPMT